MPAVVSVMLVSTFFCLIRLAETALTSSVFTQKSDLTLSGLKQQRKKKKNSKRTRSSSRSTLTCKDVARTGCKLQNQWVHWKTVGHCSSNYYWGEGEELPTKACQPGLTSLTSAGDKITPPPQRHKSSPSGATDFPWKAFCAHSDFAHTSAHPLSLQTHFMPPPPLSPLPPCFSSGIQTLPHNAKVHYNYANFLKDSGRHREAIHHYTTALRSDSELELSDCTNPHSTRLQMLPVANGAVSFVCLFTFLDKPKFRFGVQSLNLIALSCCHCVCAPFAKILSFNSCQITVFPLTERCFYIPWKVCCVIIHYLLKQCLLNTYWPQGVADLPQNMHTVHTAWTTPPAAPNSGGVLCSSPKYHPDRTQFYPLASYPCSLQGELNCALHWWEDNSNPDLK